MANKEYFNEMAERAARLATAVRDPELAARFRLLAVEYFEMASEAPDEEQASRKQSTMDRGEPT